jgi:hypothetical protein
MLQNIEKLLADQQFMRTVDRKVTNESSPVSVEQFGVDFKKNIDELLTWSQSVACGARGSQMEVDPSSRK